jgi:hypothetical protein
MTVLWAAAAFALALPVLRSGVFDAMSTDDAMRLVEVRDWISGQNWFDVSQHRLDPPGAAMHWSRVTDVPLAALMLLLRPLLGSHGAEIATLFAWPLALLAATLSLVAAIAAHMSADAVRSVPPTAAMLAVLSTPALIHFRPGAIDHHNSQIVLLLALVLLTLQIERSAAKAALAGLMASLSLAIGVEMLPAIAAIGIAVCGLLVWRGAAVARQATAYGAALACSSLLLAVTLMPLNAVTLPVCDAFGGPVLLLIAGGGIGLIAIAGIDRWQPRLALRLCTAALCGSALLALFIKLYPGCLASPYARVDPLLASVWLDHVAETMSFLAILQLAPQKILAFYGFPLLTLGLGSAALIRSKAAARFPWVTALATLIALFGISVWQVRGAAAATVVATPIFAAALILLWPMLLLRRRLLVAALLMSPAALGGLGLAARPAIDALMRPEQRMTDSDPAASCQTVTSVAPLLQLPRGRVMAPIDLGPAILAATDHAVFAAPYHRNNDGNLAMLNLMLASPAPARRMLRERSVDYVVLCPAAPEQSDFVRLAPQGLAARLGRGETPDDLVPLAVDDASGLKVWHVRR